MKNERSENNKAITLVALIVTIVVIIILAAISINLIFGDNGIVNRSKEAAERTKFESDLERLQLALTDIKMDSLVNNTVITLETAGEKLEEKQAIREGWFLASNEGIDNEENDSDTTSSLVGKVNQNIPKGNYLQVKSWQYGYTFYIDGNLGLIYNELKEQIKEPEEGQVLFSEPGRYKLTINAGAVARWIALVKYEEYIPEGASIVYKFQTSNDRQTWTEEVSNIDSLPQSQYVKVIVDITANSSGECPYVKGLCMRFTIDNNIQEIRKEANKQILKFKEPVVGSDTVIDIPVNVTKDGKTSTYSIKVSTDPNKTDISALTNNGIGNSSGGSSGTGGSGSSGSSSGASNSGIVVSYSNDGTNWTETPISGQKYNYVKIDTNITDTNGATISYGTASVSPKTVEAQTAQKIIKESDWETVDHQYYFADASGSGEWIGIEPDEYIPNVNTRIKYTFQKSNDYETWTEESNSISENGNSRILKVIANLQIFKTSHTPARPRVNDLIINYKVNNQNKKTTMGTTMPEATEPVEIIVNEASVYEGGTVQLTATTKPSKFASQLKYTSKTTNKATVSTSGLVTGVAQGTATITASYGSQSADCAVTVNQIGISVNNVTVKKDETVQLSVTTTPSGYEDKVTYTSKNTSKATVNSSGLVTGVAQGTATITVSYGTKSVDCTVRVIGQEERLVTAWVGIVDSNNSYTTLAEVLNDSTLLNKLFSNTQAVNYMLGETQIIYPGVKSNSTASNMLNNSTTYITAVCQNSTNFSNLLKDTARFQSLLNSSTFRNAMYNNASVTENVLNNTTEGINARNAMMNNTSLTQTSEVHRSGTGDPNLLYNGKCFIFKAAYGMSYTNHYITLGYLANGNNTVGWWGNGNVNNYYYVNVNRFASSCYMWRRFILCKFI